MEEKKRFHQKNLVEAWERAGSSTSVEEVVTDFCLLDFHATIPPKSTQTWPSFE
jgi:hypothetical protein